MLIKKWMRVLVALVAIFILMQVIDTEHTKAASKMNLTDLGNYSNSSYIYDNDYNGTPFVNSEGVIVTNGISLTAYSYSRGTAYSYYNINQMGFTTFHAKISLDGNYLNGDYGKSAIGIYADDRLIYEKTISKSDKTISVDIPLPTGVKDLKIRGEFLKGAKGTQRIVVSSAYLDSSMKPIKYNDSITYLSDIGTESNSSYFYESDWNDNPFQMVDNTIATRGIALSTYAYEGGTAYATYNIDQMNYNKFQARVSLEKSMIVGDRGKSAIGIYADDTLLIEKQLTSKSPVFDININIPKDTKVLKVIVSQVKGAKGTQGVIIANPVLKKTTESLVTGLDMVSMQTVGVTNSSYVYGLGGIGDRNWNETPFQLINGDIVTDGIGLTTYAYSGGTSYVTSNIKEMGYQTFKTQLSLDSKWANGDYGSSIVYIYGDNKLLYSVNLSKISSVIDINLPLATNITNFTIKVIQQNGAKGTQKIVLKNPGFTTKDLVAPKAPTVNVVTDKMNYISGKAEAGATVYAEIGGKVYKVVASANGDYKVIIPIQKQGTAIVVYAKDKAQNKSQTVSIKVVKAK